MGFISSFNPGADVVQKAAPATLGTVNIAAGTTSLLINPAGTIAALTVNLPSNPFDGQSVTISSSQIITALTVGNGTIIGTLTTLALGGFAKFTYNATTSSWFRTG